MPKAKTKISPLTVKRLKEEMQFKNCTWKDLSEDCGISMSMIGHILSERRPLTYGTALTFAEYFNVRPQYLLGNDDIRTDEEFEVITEYLNNIDY